MGEEKEQQVTNVEAGRESPPSSQSDVRVTAKTWFVVASEFPSSKSTTPWLDHILTSIKSSPLAMASASS